jgi:ankyrin repeat protein
MTNAHCESHIFLVQLLISRNVHINACTVSGQSAMHWLIIEQNALLHNAARMQVIDRVLHTLLAQNIDVSLHDKSESTG